VSNLTYLRSLRIYNDYRDDEKSTNKIFYISEKINKLTNLTELVIRNVGLQQKLFNLFNFPSLEILDISNNSISGVLSGFYINTPKLKQINISQNLFTGQMDSLARAPLLEKVELQGNQISGNVPDFVSKNLQVLDVRNNKLAGNFPVD
jgi:Leucine-rich repeat (LRR) protein